MSSWLYWEWILYIALFTAAGILAVDQVVKVSSGFAQQMHAVVANSYWAFAPLALVLLAIIILTGRELSWIARKAPLQAAFDPNAKLEQIFKKIYHNQAVILDGKEFVDCTFDNVTLFYQGDAPFLLTDAHFPAGSHVRFGSNNPAIKIAAGLILKIAQIVRGADSTVLPQ
jgi:hypothetical protein